ncbi:hypothetical protein [Winogradskyella sp. SYSU M77433]|uniref:hypothetical protein n=1 Tax=Winogradskyella sp. SYSU M77433 TaxID=3042722 RepID=UPI00248099B6|nr:hypothetical protein [Winogradskyella sp. SYSU M77433]MDH7913912.1 hypothetical protein [Winogradskyella sp. SYSU M77433]|tara:strand:+ start:410 stop:625 length:216 start_codon:yes stop_codon:yes gene_type:complete
MKKQIIMLSILSLLAFTTTSCREEKSADEKVEEAMDNLGEDLEDASDDVQDAAEDLEDEIDEAIEESNDNS